MLERDFAGSPASGFNVSSSRPVDPFGDIHPDTQCYCLKIADRIAGVEDLREVDRLVGFIPRKFFNTILGIALQGIAVRIARIEPERDGEHARAVALQRRREEIAKLPGDLAARVAPLMASYYRSKPWRHKARAYGK